MHRLQLRYDDAAVQNFARGVGGTAPPSVLPDISPTRGEIGSLAVLPSSTLEIGESRGDIQSPPLWGRCPEGQRGALSRRRCGLLPVIV
ncbi:hypothetical protein MESS4_210067 [Mesorhizobium sp. STM 4661]|nr:hypothetical protein MESS4_210067 [Mesorhizobium sp. STM 4661]